MSHLKHSVSPSVRGPYVPSVKGSPLASYFDFDRFIHSHWQNTFPPVNMKETDKSFEIELLVPGYNKKDFKISIDEEFLTVSAVKHEGEKQEDDYIQRQFAPSSFSRSFHLPANANDSDIVAKYDEGILRLTIPKKILTTPKLKKSIEVSE